MTPADGREGEARQTRDEGPENTAALSNKKDATSAMRVTPGKINSEMKSVGKVLVAEPRQHLFLR